METFEFETPGHRRGVALGRRVGSIEHCGWRLHPKRFRSAHTKQPPEGGRTNLHGFQALRNLSVRCEVHWPASGGSSMSKAFST